MKTDILKLYIGCYAMHGNQKIHVSGINVNSDKIQNIICQETIPISEIKLILRPLSSMTQEEAIDVYTIENAGRPHYKIEDFDVRVQNDAWQVTRLDMPDIHLFISNSGRIWKVVLDDGEAILDVLQWQAKMYQYLLSKGFDLFNLIESGSALDGTKL